VQSSRHSRFSIDEGLHSETYAIYPMLQHGGENGIIKLPRGALKRDLGAFDNVESVLQRVPYPVQQQWTQYTRRTASEIQAVDPSREIHMQPVRACANALDFQAKPVDVAFQTLLGMNSRRKVAIGAL
jgi:hypothetical protein